MNFYNARKTLKILGIHRKLTRKQLKKFCHHVNHDRSFNYRGSF